MVVLLCFVLLLLPSTEKLLSTKQIFELSCSHNYSSVMHTVVCVYTCALLWYFINIYILVFLYVVINTLSETNRTTTTTTGSIVDFLNFSTFRSASLVLVLAALDAFLLLKATMLKKGYKQLRLTKYL